MMRRFVSAASGARGVRDVRASVCAAAAVATMAVVTPSQAQEVQVTGPLKGAPAVRDLRQYREGRFEFAPTVSFSLLDEYRRTILAGARIQYNIKDWIGIGVWGAYGVASLATDLTGQIDNTSPRSDQTATNVAPKCTPGQSNCGFDGQTARIKWVAAPQIQLVPFRGKLAIFQKIFVDTDAYLHLGAAFVGVDERGDCGATGQVACTDPTSFALKSRVAIAPTGGLGLTFYPSNFFSIGLEYRALPFAWNRAGFDSRGAGNNAKFPDGKVDSQDQTFKFNQMISISVGLFPQSRKTSE